jgi:outer membrane lipoprotein SlyB
MMIMHTLIRFAGALVLLLLLGCRSTSSSSDAFQLGTHDAIRKGTVTPSDDAKLQQRITGTWTLSLDGGVRSIIIFGSGGDYLCKVFDPGGVLLAQIEGTFVVRAGFLIETVVKDSQTDAPVPRTSRAAIVRTGEQELVLMRGDTGGEAVLRRESK